MEHIQQLTQLIKEAKKITFFTGAGISTESGIPDWRSSNGLYTNNEGFQELISLSYFKSNPEGFWKPYKEIYDIKLLNDYKPNSGHQFITKLQEQGKHVTVITQNNDGLHTAAGTKKVYEVHGTLTNASCPKCRTVYDLDYINNNDIPRCTQINAKEEICDSILRPDIVLFGDPIKYFNESLNNAYASDLFIVMGTSLEVGPINSIPQYIGRTDIPMVLINKDKTNFDDLFDFCIYSGIGETLEEVEKGLRF
ncbi:NAD-dependent protein deacylase [Priestia megaterium]|uniref:protein acetyllysine N-acetyltransferase n=1 Tax=Priestia megaterium TaxID=1404 RepID=A0A6M6E140_PRIMG|nr:NAD-dependent protein deacylase [Priestia megaterium]QJX80773.1 NAD-dependent protein deacylase [Priestia megaterium]